jgi:hypothetical protein
VSWDDLYQSSPCSHVFARAEYLDLVGRTFRGRIDEAETGNDLDHTGATRLLTRRSPFTLRAVAAPFTPYSAILLDRMPSEAETHERESNLENILAELEHRYAGIDIRLPPKMVDVRTFTWRKWAVQPLYTYRIRLSETRDGAEWSESARRIALRSEGDYEIVDPGPETLANLSVAGYERNNKRAPLSKTRLAAFIQEATKGVGAELVGARRQSTGEIESAIAILRDESVAYYWIAGGTPGASMTVLLRELFQRLADEGLEIFDFVGANTDSIAEFKRRFGGRLTTYFRARWRKGPLIVAEDVILRMR